MFLEMDAMYLVGLSDCFKAKLFYEIIVEIEAFGNPNGPKDCFPEAVPLQ